MPFVLHPSGFCSYFTPAVSANLRPGEKCPDCGRIAGHAVTCPHFKFNETRGASSRPKLFNACSVLWHDRPKKNFITFTLPSGSGSYTYQRSADCIETGDLVVGRKFSKLLEAWSKRETRKRALLHPHLLPENFTAPALSYVWVAESQQKRKAKFGGIGEIHYHLVANQEIKRDDGRVSDPETLSWLQELWCSHLGVSSAKNCIDVRPIPQEIRSIPGYVSKYMGKDGGRTILSRQFQATQDLSRFQPIHLSRAPELPLVSKRDYVTADGYEGTAYYYPTSSVLDLYGSAMAHQGSVTGREHKDPNFTREAILERAIHRQRILVESWSGS